MRVGTHHDALTAKGSISNEIVQRDVLYVTERIISLGSTTLVEQVVAFPEEACEVASGLEVEGISREA